jgi:hypothetical protein
MRSPPPPPYQNYVYVLCAQAVRPCQLEELVPVLPVLPTRVTDVRFLVFLLAIHQYGVNPSAIACCAVRNGTPNTRAFVDLPKSRRPQMR